MSRAYEVKSAKEDAEFVIRWLVDCVAEAEAGGFAWVDRGAVIDALNEARDWRVRYAKRPVGNLDGPEAVEPHSFQPWNVSTGSHPPICVWCGKTDLAGPHGIQPWPLGTGEGAP